MGGVSTEWVGKGVASSLLRCLRRYLLNVTAYAAALNNLCMHVSFYRPKTFANLKIPATHSKEMN